MGIVEGIICVVLGPCGPGRISVQLSVTGTGGMVLLRVYPQATWSEDDWTPLFSCDITCFEQVGPALDQLRKDFPVVTDFWRGVLEGNIHFLLARGDCAEDMTSLPRSGFDNSAYAK